MVLISSGNYADIQRKIRELKTLAGNTTGEAREDDSRLGQIDDLLADIEELLHPATDDR